MHDLNTSTNIVRHIDCMLFAMICKIFRVDKACSVCVCALAHVLSQFRQTLTAPLLLIRLFYLIITKEPR